MKKSMLLMNLLFKRIIVLIGAMIFLLVTACGSGSSDSSASQNAITESNVAQFVGVYQGSESVRLIRESDSSNTDISQNEVFITISQSGALSFSSSGGNQGQAQITNGKTFVLRADARTQFDGACSSGTIYLSGVISENEVSANYSSDNLICNEQSYRVEGDVLAQR